MTNRLARFVIPSSFDFRHSSFCRFLRLHHHPPHVIAAIGADDVRRHCRRALGAEGKLLGGFGVVAAPFAGAGIGLTPLGNGHDTISLSSCCQQTYVPSGWSNRWKLTKLRVRGGGVKDGAEPPFSALPQEATFSYTCS